MRDQELELIAALVEGRLEDEAEARALIASSPELRAEYEAQKLAYETLRGAKSVGLDESERAALHRDVWTAVRHEKIATTPSPWYYRWIPVTAGLLLVLVGLVAVLGQVGDESGGFDEIAAELAEGDSEGEAESLDEHSAEADDMGRDGEEAFDGPTETTVAASEPMPSDEAAEIYEREADLLRQGVYGDRLRSYDSTNTAMEACVEESGLSDHRILATLSAPLESTDTTRDERRLAVASPEGEQLADTRIFFVDLGTCQVVYVDEP